MEMANKVSKFILRFNDVTLDHLLRFDELMEK